MLKIKGKPENSTASDMDRLTAIDVMRGIVIVLMAFDHASGVFNAGRYVTDSAAFYRAGSVIPEAQFIARWITHLCAPTFLYLAGWSLSLSVRAKKGAGVSDGHIDLFLLKRGLLILLLDPIWMSIAFGYGIVFQVLYAIGGSLCCMTLLRRLKTHSIWVLGLTLILFSEVLAGLATQFGAIESPGIITSLLVTGGRIDAWVYVLYPLIPWLGYMVLGWGTGQLTIAGQIKNPAILFGQMGFITLFIFVIVRGLNGYGNMLLYRDNGSLLQWLHVSKYPPSFSFAALELGIMFLGLAMLFLYDKNRPPLTWNPLAVYGQTPLFFYILHVHLLSAAAWLLNLKKKGGLSEAFVATLVVLFILYPACLWYRRLKLSRKYSLLRYL
jgi:uncharacterized membrane protein